MNWESADASDSFGKEFFSRSLFRSGYFLVASSLFLAVMFCSVWFFLRYWSRLPSEFICLLFVFLIIGSVRSMSVAVNQHKSLRALYFSVESAPGVSDDRASAALDVAARVILDYLFYTSFLSLLFLFVVYILLTNPGFHSRW